MKKTAKIKIGIGALSITTIGSIGMNIFMYKAIKNAESACEEYKKTNDLLINQIEKQTMIEVTLERCRGLYAIGELEEELKLHSMISEIRGSSEKEFKEDYKYYVDQNEKAKNIINNYRDNQTK